MYIDEILLYFVNFLASNFGIILTPFFRLISIIADKGIIFLIIGFFMMLNKKTRWIGVSIWISILIGYIINSVFLKNIILRVRPYMSSNPNYYKYWEQVGSIHDTGYSMPSGHTLAASAFMMSLIFTCKQSEKKKFIILYFVVVLLMTFSRMYFMHHYFTDCLIGAILGIICAVVGKILTKMIYRYINKHKNNTICNFIINYDFIGKDD